MQLVHLKIFLADVEFQNQKGNLKLLYYELGSYVTRFLKKKIVNY